MILISACLAGMNCRYDGKNNFSEKIKKLMKNENTILVCPEQLGGLSTPRIPAEIIEQRVINKDGFDVTEQFRKGAEETLKIAKMYRCTKAILKQRSPSCGFGQIYDGSHSGRIVKGMGITAKLLVENGIEIVTEEEI